MDWGRCMEFGRSIIDGVEIKLCSKEPHAYKHHVHKELSLGYIVEGTTDLTLHDRTIHYRDGNGVIIPPLMTHKCAPNDIDHWSYAMLFVDPDYFGDLVCFPRARKLTGAQALKLKGFIDRLMNDQYMESLESVLIDLLLEFGETNPAEIAADADDHSRMIHDYIIQHVNDVITLDQLQEMAGQNKFTIIRNFKKAYVTTPAAYHLQNRVAEAKRMLGKGMDVFDICEALKFYDQAHFIREFKKMYGITPGTYVAQISG